MTSITEKLKNEHHDCEQKFCIFESTVESGNWKQSQPCWHQFVDALQTHIRFEEEILFPAFEKVTQLSPLNGPTAVMRLEHQQFKQQIKIIQQMLKEHDKQGLQDVADELMASIQQHSFKEESILYPLCDRHLKLSELYCGEN